LSVEKGERRGKLVTRNGAIRDGAAKAEPTLAASGEPIDRLIEQFAARLDETVGFLVWDTARAYQHVSAPMLARHGIGFGLYHFLRILHERDGLTFRELSDAAHLRGPTTVVAIRELESRGLVRRKRNPTDARKINIFLTKRGETAYKAIIPVSAMINRRGVAGLSIEDQDTLKRLLRHIRGNMLNERVRIERERNGE
jgi:MarR family transcriptional regulator, organic hydroperoxide resistance regulator